MRSGPFISLISSTFGVPETTVIVVARALREAGWITSGARGVNAPHMTSRDAARLSLALLTGEPPSRVVHEFEFIRSLQTKKAFPTKSLISKWDLPANHSAEDMLTALFGVFADWETVVEYSEEWKGFRVGLSFSFSVDASYRTATVNLPDFSNRYHDLVGAVELAGLDLVSPQTPEIIERIKELELRGASVGSVVMGRGMRVVRTITQDEIETITRALHDL